MLTGPFPQGGGKQKEGIMKKAIVVAIICMGAVTISKSASAGWFISKNSPLGQLKSACSEFYEAATEKEKQLQLKRASDAMAKLKDNAWITEKKIISTLKKYKKSQPKSVAVVILALETYNSEALAVFYNTIVTPDSIQWANAIVHTENQALLLSAK
jgi:hypothetical protein